MIAEESVSRRAITRVYNEQTEIKDETLTPKDIFRIAEGEIAGDRQAAVRSFKQLGEVAGDDIAHLLTLGDGIVVIGGGIIGAAKYLMSMLIIELHTYISHFFSSTLYCYLSDV